MGCLAHTEAVADVVRQRAARQALLLLILHRLDPLPQLRVLRRQRLRMRRRPAPTARLSALVEAVPRARVQLGTHASASASSIASASALSHRRSFLARSESTSASALFAWSRAFSIERVARFARSRSPSRRASCQPADNRSGFVGCCNRFSASKAEHYLGSEPRELIRQPSILLGHGRVDVILRLLHAAQLPHRLVQLPLQRLVLRRCLLSPVLRRLPCVPNTRS